jgi:hypothetical protein
MTAEQAVAQYYDAWRTRRGDMGGVPLAEDFRFVGPVASFETADGFREMARQAGQVVTSFEVRRQFVDGNTVGTLLLQEGRDAGAGAPAPLSSKGGSDRPALTGLHDSEAAV